MLSRIRFVNGNTLKLIALIAMTVDHIGAILFPGLIWMRIVGRFSFPIFAFLISEGCLYTRSRKKYIGLILAVDVICQLVFYISDHSLSQCVLTTFIISICLIFLFDNALKNTKNGNIKKAVLLWASFAAAILADAFICFILTDILSIQGFYIDYGFFGTLLPLLCYVPEVLSEKIKEKGELRFFLKLSFMVIGLLLISLTAELSVQWVSLFTIFIIFFYNGKRGKLKMKYFFYVYYPIHLALIYLISIVI